MDTCAFFPPTGRQRRMKLRKDWMAKVEELINNSQARSIDLMIDQEIYQVRYQELTFNFGKRRRTENDGFNKLALFLPLELAAGNWQTLSEYFRRIIDILGGCYGYCCIHIDSPDSLTTKQEVRRRQRNEALDALSWNRYVWTCDMEIRDVAWLNFISSGHLSRLPESIVAHLSPHCTTVEMLENGLFFSLADSPFLDKANLSATREILQPVICQDNWYELD
jgi:hypothetical protein